MTVEVKYNSRTGKWDIITTKKGGSTFGYTFSSSSSHDTRQAAVRKARRVARDNEKIKLINTNGNVEMVRQGEFLP